MDNGAMTTRRDVAVLGSTGSIGTQALDLVRANPDRFRVVALTAGGSQPDLFEAQVAEFAPTFSGLGAGASAEAASRPADVVLNGITGAVGLGATLAALDAGNTLALANKESLIMGGPLVLERAKPGQIVPVDSEHSALAQCLRGGTPEEVRRLVLTASGGPFRGRTRGQLLDVTLDEALAHPTWDMGPVVTINSANLVNKGLEVIEAHLLFGLPYDRIEVVVHPTSVVHSMVEFVDGSTLVQAQPAHHADPDRARPGRGRTGSPRRPRRSTGPRSTPGSSSRSTTRRSRRSTWPAWRGSGAPPHLRSTTRPTRWRSRRSEPVGSGSSRSSTRSPTCSGSTTYPRERH